MFNLDNLKEILRSTPYDELPVEGKLYRMAEFGAELEEMAIEVDLDIDKMIQEHSGIIMKGRVKGMLELRREQYYSAVGDRKPAMLKHLGAHRLGQIDELIVKSSAKDGINKVVDLKTLSKDELLLKIAQYIQPESEKPKDETPDE